MSVTKTVMTSIKKRFDEVVDEAVKITKGEVNVRSGALRDAIGKEKKGDFEAMVGVDADKLKADPRNIGKIDYSMPYWKGHRTYTIVPKNGGVLSWIGKDGKRAYSKGHKIPAHAGDPFIERAIAKLPKF